MLNVTLLKQYEVVKHLISSLGGDKNTPDYLDFLDDEILEYETFIADLKDNLKAVTAVRKQIARGTVEPQRQNKLPISQHQISLIRDTNKSNQLHLTLN